MILIMIIVVIGCSKEPTCKGDYYEFKQGDCCLDKDHNSVCDADEITTTIPTTIATTTEMTTEETSVLPVEEQPKEVTRFLGKCFNDISWNYLFYWEYWGFKAIELMDAKTRKYRSRALVIQDNANARSSDLSFSYILPGLTSARFSKVPVINVAGIIYVSSGGTNMFIETAHFKNSDDFQKARSRVEEAAEKLKIYRRRSSSDVEFSISAGKFRILGKPSTDDFYGYESAVFKTQGDYFRVIFIDDYNIILYVYSNDGKQDIDKLIRQYLWDKCDSRIATDKFVPVDTIGGAGEAISVIGPRCYLGDICCTDDSEEVAGKLTEEDAELLQQAVDGKKEITEQHKYLADFNDDGVITSQDPIEIYSTLMNITLGVMNEDDLKTVPCEPAEGAAIPEIAS